MNTIPTAKEMLKQEDGYLPRHYAPHEVVLYMIEFAQRHVEEALKAAAVKAELDLTDNYRGCVVSDTTILNAYPPENIK